MSKKSVVILDQVSGYAQIDIIEALFTQYDECVLIAGEIKERNKPFPSQAIWEKVIPYNRNTSYQRVKTWLIGSLQMFFKVLFKHRKSRIIAISNPPFAIFIPWLLNCKYDVVIYDIYPDALVHMGYLSKDSLWVKLWSRFNKKVFNNADRIITLSEGMREVLTQYTNPNKIEVIPNWSFNSELPIVPKQDNVVLNNLGVTDKFIISYSGNFGVTHPLEVLVELASKLDPAKFHVIVAGDGAGKPRIKQALNKFKPTNFSLLPWQPANQLHHVLSMGDLGVVILDDTAANISIPSKTYDLLSAGTPILAICSETASLRELLMELDCGLSVNKNNIESMVNIIYEMNQNSEKLNELSSSALKASKNFTHKNAENYI